MTSAQTLDGPRLLASIDDYLGPRESRFFGEGFTRVSHRLRDAAVLPGPDGRPLLTATASITFPQAWSTKGDVVQRPHLSSVDALVMAELLCREFLRAPIGTSAGRQITIRSARLWGGNRPQEDGLTDFGVGAERVRTHVLDGRSGRVVSVFDCSFGALRAQLSVEHPGSWTVSGAPEAVASEVIDDPIEPDWSQRRQWITDLVLDRTTAHVSGIVRIHPHDIRPRVADDFADAVADVHDRAHAARRDGRLLLAATMLDCLVIGAQLGQVLLYDVDGLSRATSNTLWMRHTRLDMVEAEAEAGVVAVVTRLDKSSLLDVRGQTWRVADIVSAIGPIRMRCSVAHQLPDGVAR